MKLLKKRLPCLAVTAAVLLALAACHGEKISESDKLTVVTTTTMLCDLAGQIGGERVEVWGLMGSGVDPHQYRASAGDISKMQNADAVIYSGLHLEGKMGDVFASLEKNGSSGNADKKVICAARGLKENEIIYNDGVPDPHIWFDVHLWSLAAEEVAKGLAEADPENEADYKNNLEQYKRQLAELDSYIRTKTEEIPQSQRVLITAHDAFGYFGRAYGYEVRGLQGISTAAEAGTADVSRLADFIADNKIKAVFVESSLPVKNIQALMEAVRSRGFETSLGGSLYSDSTGDAETGTDTYIGAFKHNADVIVQALKP